jgi:hypothetical protein
LRRPHASKRSLRELSTLREHIIIHWVSLADCLEHTERLRNRTQRFKLPRPNIEGGNVAVSKHTCQHRPNHPRSDHIPLQVIVIDLNLQIAIHKIPSTETCVNCGEHRGCFVQHRVQSAPMRARDPPIPSHNLCTNNLLCVDPVLGPLERI